MQAADRPPASHLWQEGVEAQHELLMPAEELLDALYHSRSVDPAQKGQTGPNSGVWAGAGGQAAPWLGYLGSIISPDAAAGVQTGCKGSNGRAQAAAGGGQLAGRLPAHRPHLCALNSFMISRNVSYTSFLSAKRFLTSRRYVRASLVVSLCCAAGLSAGARMTLRGTKWGRTGRRGVRRGAYRLVRANRAPGSQVMGALPLLPLGHGAIRARVIPLTLHGPLGWAGRACHSVADGWLKSRVGSAAPGLRRAARDAGRACAPAGVCNGSWVRWGVGGRSGRAWQRCGKLWHPAGAAAARNVGSGVRVESPRRGAHPCEPLPRRGRR